MDLKTPKPYELPGHTLCSCDIPFCAACFESTLFRKDIERQIREISKLMRPRLEKFLATP
jgi:hypothetical protein